MVVVPEETFEYPEGVWGLLKDILRFWIVFRSILDRYSTFNGSFFDPFWIVFRSFMFQNLKVDPSTT